jgi:hypothetical protein
MKLVRPIPLTTANTTSTVPQTEALWSGATSYAVAAVVYEEISGRPQRFISKVAANLNHRPSTDLAELYWDADGSTNRWSMFDGAIQTQTSNPESIDFEVQLAPSEKVDTVFVTNINGTASTVKVTAAGGEVVYDKEHTLVSNAGIQDWYAYFNEPTVRKSGLIASDLPGMYPGAKVSVSIKAPGDVARAGLALMGLARQLGGTKWGAELGFRDLSVKAENEFGGLYVVERPFKRTASFDVVVQAGFVDQLQHLLEQYRATPVLFVGNDAYETMHIYGFVKSFKTVVTTPDVSFCALDLESLA